MIVYTKIKKKPGNSELYNFNKYICLIQDGSLLLLDKEEKKWVYPREHKLSRLKDFIYMPAEAPDHSIWLGTSHGLRIYNNGIFTESDILKGEYIKILCTLKDGTLLIGTKESGLYIYKNEELVKCEKDSFGKKLPLEYSSILLMKDNNLYLPTNIGILKIQNN